MPLKEQKFQPLRKVSLTGAMERTGFDMLDVVSLHRNVLYTSIGPDQEI